MKKKLPRGAKGTARQQLGVLCVKVKGNQTNKS